MSQAVMLILGSMGLDHALQLILMVYLLLMRMWKNHLQLEK